MDVHAVLHRKGVSSALGDAQDNFSECHHFLMGLGGKLVTKSKEEEAE